MVPTTCRKGTQALNYFAKKKDGKINKMKAMKLIYLADRFHLRKYGRPIVGDSYWAMKYGPVASEIFDIADQNKMLQADCLNYASAYIGHPEGDLEKRTIESKADIDLDVFSQTDIEAFESVYKEFGGYDEFELAEITHKYPEWAKFEKVIESGEKKREQMSYLDFFSNPQNNGSDFFDLPEDHLELTKEVFEENLHATSALQ